jgi:hypothetical protein
MPVPADNASATAKIDSQQAFSAMPGIGAHCSVKWFRHIF